MKRFSRIVAGLAVFCGCLGTHSAGFAQGSIPYSLQGKIEPNLDPEANQAFRYIPRPEPVFKQVKYLKQDPPRSLSERIERLIHAIYVDVPPEYDHYGYEIRRYMASISGPKVLNSSANIEGQIKNIKNAQIVLRYWRDTHNKEIKAIEAKIEEVDASSSTRSSFKYHRGVAKAFFVEADSWLNNNLVLLEYLLEIGPRAYKFEDPVIMFNDERHLAKYASYFKAQQQALEQIQGYTPFRMMVY